MRRVRIGQVLTSNIETRLLACMIAIALATTFGLLTAGHFRFALGFATGAAIALLGYLWLCELAAKALDSGSRRVAKKLVLKLLIRYPLFFGALYLFYRTNWLSTWAVLAGLSVPLASGIVEGLYQVQAMLLHSRTQPER